MSHENADFFSGFFQAQGLKGVGVKRMPDVSSRAAPHFSFLLFCIASRMREQWLRLTQWRMWPPCVFYRINLLSSEARFVINWTVNLFKKGRRLGRCESALPPRNTSIVFWVLWRTISGFRFPGVSASDWKVRQNDSGVLISVVVCAAKWFCLRNHIVIPMRISEINLSYFLRRS